VYALSVCSCWSLLVCLSLMALVPLAFGQGGGGTITGTVTDPTGLVIPGVDVEATNAETGAVYSGSSARAGNYAIPNLPVGTYVLSVKVACRPSARSGGMRKFLASLSR
jgi:Carboxypeptidase regulatory-like domain